MMLEHKEEMFCKSCHRYHDQVLKGNRHIRGHFSGVNLAQKVTGLVEYWPMRKLKAQKK